VASGEAQQVDAHGMKEKQVQVDEFAIRCSCVDNFAATLAPST